MTAAPPLRIWRLHRKRCARCGAPCVVRRYPLARGGWAGTPYCRRCAAWHKIKGRAKVVGMLRCERCRRRYEVTVGEVYNMRVRGTTPRYCGAACMAEATRVYRLNPRGPMFCRAPVRGGCDRPRCRKGRDGDIRPFCSAHDKRRDRGQSLTAPIGRAGQRVGL